MHIKLSILTAIWLFNFYPIESTSVDPKTYGLRSVFVCFCCILLFAVNLSTRYDDWFKNVGFCSNLSVPFWLGFSLLLKRMKVVNKNHGSSIKNLCIITLPTSLDFCLQKWSFFPSVIQNLILIVTSFTVSNFSIIVQTFCPKNFKTGIIKKKEYIQSGLCSFCLMTITSLFFFMKILRKKMYISTFVFSYPIFSCLSNFSLSPPEKKIICRLFF